MSLSALVKGKYREFRGRGEQSELIALGAPEEISRGDWPKSLVDPTGFYGRAFRYFHTRLPEKLREHRTYFTQERRGFGEDAFHTMWFLLFREFKPRNFLEIGVYRGQTLSLAALLQKEFGCEGELVGISPFTSAGDSVSKYLREVDYHEDTLKNFARYSARKPTLVKGFSTDAAAVEFMNSRKWDCVYIDGNHDYEIARQDWENTSRNLAPSGLIVLDDSGLSTAYQAPHFATAGHPGPSRLADEVKKLPNFQEILQVGHNRVFQLRANR